MSWLPRLLDRLDGLPDRALLLIDLCIGLFVLAAHGGLLLLVRLGKVPELEHQAPWLLVSVVVFACVVVSSGWALIRKSARGPVLGAHATVFLVGAVAMVAWAAGIVLEGIPTGVNFSWSPGMFTALVFYGVYLFRRQFLLDYVSGSPLAHYCHLGAAIVALALDLGVLVRLLLDFRNLSSGLSPGL